MNKNLWRYYLEDDVDSFRQLLEGGGAGGRVYTQKSSTGYSKSYELGEDDVGVASPTSPILKGRFPTHKEIERPTVALTRADVNARDSRGLTLLHHSASSTAENANGFALALLAHPFVDLYVEDFENGWTALHRAFYFGNIAIAQAILERDAPTAGNVSSASGQIASLAKIKDREGHGPYDLLSATIADRSLRTANGSSASVNESLSDGGRGTGNRSPESDDEQFFSKSLVPPTVNVRADEVFTFGSNKNLTLGLGDQDDRQYPERIYLGRPDRLFRRFHQQYVASKVSRCASANSAYAEKLQAQEQASRNISSLPDVIRFKPIMIQDVQMAKFHSAVVTTDPIANLYVCGHGLGGRLGTGNEKTLFTFNCLDEFGSARISAISLGQDHTLAVTDRGELYSWGSNMYGQLGCGLSKENAKPEEAMQLSPKQIFGPMKKEVIVGVAASRIHSVAHTSNALFTFGKNEGQLGLMDSQAGTLKVQSSPRQVYASRLSSNIHSVSAIDRATVILLDNREVHVFANYGAVKLQFPLDGFSNYFLRQSFLTTRYEKTVNKIVKITCGGDTICALSSSGEVFTVTVNQRLDPSSSATTSTTNPSKIKAALSTPHRAWTLRNDRTAARDVGVDADGSIIISTEAGGVFRRIRRPKATGSHALARREQKSKDFKFARVPNLTRAVGVRASSSGAYCAFREDCNVTRTELAGSDSTLWQDMFGMLSFKGLADDSPAPTFWQRPDAAKRVIENIAHASDVESQVSIILRQDRSWSRSADLMIRSTASEHSIPAHQVVLAGRSPVFRQALAVLRRTGEYDCDAFSMRSNDDNKVMLVFSELDFLTLLEMTLYLYSDALVGFWRLRHQSPHMAYRYKQVRTELMRIGTRLDLKNLEAAARKVITRPEPSLAIDFELALLDPAFYSSCDARVQLADGEVLVHSELMSRRCPFFKGLFQGHAGDQWLAGRVEGAENLIEVDLSHVELHVFKLVLRFLYADTGEEMFDGVSTGDLDDFLDLVMEVLSVANELMLDNLSRTCQAVLGRFVTTRNACQLLNAAAPSSIEDFKNVTLEYLCLSLEPLLANRWLDELDEELLQELDEVVRENQRAAAPFVRSGRQEALLHEKYPELAGILIRARQAKIDALEIRAKFPDAGSPVATTLSKSRPSPALNAKTPRSKDSPTPVEDNLTKDFASGRALEPLPSPAQNSSSLKLEGSPPTESPPGQPHTTGRPWAAAPLPCAKLGMKDIMEQASSYRTSNISLGLHAHSGTERRVSGSAAKLSQKERKRQQQQILKPETEQTLPHTPLATTSSPTPSSPWKTVPTSGKASSPHLGSSPLAIPSKANQSRSAHPKSPATPQLTMRQTVANAPASKSKEPTLGSPATPKQIPRSVSTPLSSQPSGANTQELGSGESPGVPIKSIRHHPRPEMPPEFYMNQSLADIMSREQADKTTLKDAVAKRSLQEIQDEQVFQEWWDKESAAVQEAQHLSESPANRRSRGGSRGRGRARGRKGGKQRAEAGDAGSSSKS